MRKTIWLSILMLLCGRADIRADEKFYARCPESGRIMFGAIADSQFENAKRSYRSRQWVAKVAADYRDTKLKKIKTCEILVWRLESIELQTTAEGRQYWLVKFDEIPLPGCGLSGPSPTWQIVVLMDGTIIEPVFEVGEERFFGGFGEGRRYGIISDADFRRTEHHYRSKQYVNKIAAAYHARELLNHKYSEIADWKLYSIELTTISDDRQYWIVEFRLVAKPCVMMSSLVSLRIAVLMDGTIVEPK